MNSSPQPENTPPPALEMVDVAIGSMRSPNQVVLESVTWTVQVGDFWVLGGLQATGKSDLLASAAGLLRPIQGIYRIFGKELPFSFEHELLGTRLRVGLVFDGGRPFQHQTVAENILLPLRYHKLCTPDELEARAKAFLEATALLRFAHRYPNSLSLNWQQRLGLARALTLKPEVLLLDNPLTGLDPVHISWWLQTLDQLSAGHPLMDDRPLTLVATGDDLRPWRGHARQFAVLKDKRLNILEPHMLQAPPENSVLAELLGVRPPGHKT